MLLKEYLYKQHEKTLEKTGCSKTNNGIRLLVMNAGELNITAYTIMKKAIASGVPEEDAEAFALHIWSMAQGTGRFVYLDIGVDWKFLQFGDVWRGNIDQLSAIRNADPIKLMERYTKTRKSTLEKIKKNILMIRKDLLKGKGRWGKILTELREYQEKKGE